MTHLPRRGDARNAPRMPQMPQASGKIRNGSTTNGYTALRESARAQRAAHKGRKSMSKIAFALMIFYMFSLIGMGNAKDLGKLSKNPLNADSTSNPVGRFGSPVSSDSINNQVGRYGSTVSPYSATNPLSTNAPKLYDSQGNYRGRLSTNTLDPDSTSNPVGRYGSSVSPDSINNPVGAGSPLSQDSPNNPLGTGWDIEGQ